MNIKQLKKCVGKVVRVFPSPLSLTWTSWPKPIPPEYNNWRIENVDDKRRVIELSNPQGYRKEIGLDHVHDFMTDDILKLYSQMIVRGRRVYLVPLWPTAKRQRIECHVPSRASADHPIRQAPPASGGAVVFSFVFGLLVGLGLASGSK